MSFDICLTDMNLPINWTTVPIKDVAVVNAVTIKKCDEPDCIHYIDISSVGNSTLDLPKQMLYKDAPSRAKRRVKENDIIISTVRPNLRQHVLLENVGKDWIASTGFAVVSANDEVNAWYLYSFLTSDLFNEHLVRVADGGAYPAFNPKEIEEAIIPWPDSKSLTIINSTIKSFYHKIALNTQINQTLEAMAQALFKSWFVDFDPVKAKITARANGGNDDAVRRAAMAVISGKSDSELDQFKQTNPEAYAELADTADLFPEAFVESELGMIPEGWGVKNLDQIADYQNGLALQNFRPQDDEDSLPVLKIAQLSKGIADGSERATAKIKPEYIVNNGDVVFSWSGSLMVDIWCGGVAALNQHLFKVTSRHFPKWYFLHYTKHHLDEFKRIASAKAVTMGHIKREHLSQAQCVVPTIKLIEHTEKSLGFIIQKQIETRLENNTLTETRDTLLPRLLTGEIDLERMKCKG